MYLNVRSMNSGKFVKQKFYKLSFLEKKSKCTTKIPRLNYSYDNDSELCAFLFQSLIF